MEDAPLTSADGWWRFPLRKPPRLAPGDRVAIVSPCWGGPSAFPGRFEAGIRQMEQRFGITAVEMPHARREPVWLQRNPAARADDLMRAFLDPSIRAVIASIGGDDAVRLIPYIDLAVIRDNPKVFLGYSDPTAIHFACMKAGIVSFHGPTIMSGFAENGGITHLTAESFERAAFQGGPIGVLTGPGTGWTSEHLPWEDPSNQERPRRREPSTGIVWLRGHGRARGRLIGGCAEVLEMLKATDWWPPPSHWDGSILFYETSEEAPPDWLVLRWLRNFGAQGILGRLSGIVLGRPGGAMDEIRRTAQRDTVLKALDEFGLFDLPVLADLDIGHTDPIVTLPYGTMAEMDCAASTLAVLEPATADR